MDTKKIVGKRIQEYRKLRGLTQEQLAEIVDIDTISLSKIETGRNYPTAENITKIAEVLKVDVYEFFVSDNLKTNEELLEEINIGLSKISKNSQKLHIIAAAIKSVS